MIARTIDQGGTASSSQKEQYLRTNEAAQYLGLARATLAKLRCLGGGPTFRKAGARIVLYRAADLDAWVEGHGERRNTSDSPNAA